MYCIEAQENREVYQLFTGISCKNSQQHNVKCGCFRGMVGVRGKKIEECDGLGQISLARKVRKPKMWL